MIQLFCQVHMFLIAVHMLPGICPVHRLQIIHRYFSQFLFIYKPVPGAAPIAMCIQLPLCSRILLFCLCHGYIRICSCPVRRLLPKQQNVFRASYTHLGTILTLFCPAKTICLIVFPDHIRNHSYHPKILKPMPSVMFYAKRMKRFNCRHSHSRRTAEQHPVLYMDCCHPARHQHSV